MSKLRDELPKPRLRGDHSLEEILACRRSVRAFTKKPISDADISQLLWAAQGISDPEGLRTAPSAGALFPLETYVAKSSGLYHFEPARHSLALCSKEDLRPAMRRAALTQDAVVEAPVVLVMTAFYARTRRKYGECAELYVHMEAGHAAQNVLLQAAALNLGGVPIAAFDDNRISKILGLPKDEVPLYLIPIGHPR